MTNERFRVDDIDERIQRLQVRLVDHITNDHVGGMKNKISTGCHDCNNITQRITNLKGLKVARASKLIRDEL